MLGVGFDLPLQPGKRRHVVSRNQRMSSSKSSSKQRGSSEADFAPQPRTAERWKSDRLGTGKDPWSGTAGNRSYDTKIRVENKPGRRGSEERERKKQEREEEEEEGRGWMEGEVVNGEERRENVRNQRIDTSRGTRDGNTGMGKGKERESRPVKWSSLPD
ncbi:uncharacterized protein An04g05160 [Aspergillus niger]|uniref:Contig An04c0170, genomic contig n=2 Tax=Aspergillus niger TaxID=5061 RepID=A2QIY4_ASPNC|nr:uncharacterized protein An04g05160 [Aspergillus niger]CAK38778.1 unnamed protein product [Aspergillus niger]